MAQAANLRGAASAEEEQAGPHSLVGKLAALVPSAVDRFLVRGPFSSVGPLMRLRQAQKDKQVLSAVSLLSLLHEDKRPTEVEPTIVCFNVLFFTMQGAILVILYYLMRHLPAKSPFAAKGDPTMSGSTSTREWRFSLFGCLEEPTLFAFSCCCFAARWADTIRLAGFLTFAVAYACLVAPTVILNIVGLIVPQAAQLSSTLVIAMFVYYRQLMRRMFGLPSGDCGTIAEDCLVYTCCSCCAVVQEARQMEDAYQSKHPAVEAMLPLAAG